MNIHCSLTWLRSKGHLWDNKNNFSLSLWKLLSILEYSIFHHLLQLTYSWYISTRSLDWGPHLETHAIGLFSTRTTITAIYSILAAWFANSFTLARSGCRSNGCRSSGCRIWRRWHWSISWHDAEAVSWRPWWLLGWTQCGLIHRRRGYTTSCVAFGTDVRTAYISTAFSTRLATGTIPTRRFRKHSYITKVS